MLVILIDCMISLSPFIDVTRMSISTVSFLAHLSYGILCVLIKECCFIHCLQSAMVYSKSTDKVETALCRLLFRCCSVDFEHVLAI